MTSGRSISSAASHSFVWQRSSSRPSTHPNLRNSSETCINNTQPCDGYFATRQRLCAFRQSFALTSYRRGNEEVRGDQLTLILTIPACQDRGAKRDAQKQKDESPARQSISTNKEQAFPLHVHETRQSKKKMIIAAFASRNP